MNKLREQSTVRKKVFSTILRCDPSDSSVGYREFLVQKAATFFDEQFPEVRDSNLLSQEQDWQLQNQIIQIIRAKATSKVELIKVLNLSEAGICLRCRVSHWLLKAAHQLRHQYGNSVKESFTLKDLVGLILIDTGQSFSDSQTSHIFSQNKEFFTVGHFLVEYLYRLPKYPLATCLMKAVKQSDVIEIFLLQHGACPQSNWGILNKTTIAKLEKVFREFYSLSDEQIQKSKFILLSYHEIYRKDRRGQYGRCRKPSDNQQQRILDDLKKRRQLELTKQTIMEELETMAKHLREYQIYQHNPLQSTIPIERYDPETGKTLESRLKPPIVDNDVEPQENQTIQLLLKAKLINFLDAAIEVGISDVINSLKNRTKDLAPSIKEAFKLIYCEKLNQQEISHKLLIHQSRISRRIKPLGAQLFKQVKLRVKQEFLDFILKQVHENNLIEAPEELDYFDNLLWQVEAFLNKKVFLLEEEEISDSRTRQLNGLYFERLCHYLNKL